MSRKSSPGGITREIMFKASYVSYYDAESFSDDAKTPKDRKTSDNVMHKDAETANDAHPADNADAADVPVLLSFVITEAERNIPAIIGALKLKLVGVSYVYLITFIKSRHERLTFLSG